VIDCIEDTDDLLWVPGTYREYIDFEVLAQSVDAVHLTVEGEAKTRYTEPRGLYGWDCETVLVLNPNSIIHFSQSDDSFSDIEDFLTIEIQ
jgi:hypothetical protein